MREWKPARRGAFALACSPDGRKLAAGGSDSRTGPGGQWSTGPVTVWDIPDGRIAHRLEISTGVVKAVAVSPDGRAIAAAGNGHFQRGDDRLRLMNGVRRGTSPAAS
jgi:WD40 repeat protein